MNKLKKKKKSFVDEEQISNNQMCDLQYLHAIYILSQESKKKKTEKGTKTRVKENLPKSFLPSVVT